MATAWLEATVEDDGPVAAIKIAARVHPELWAALKIDCVRRRRTIGQEVHRLLCREYGRHDLLERVPRGEVIPAAPAPAPAPASAPIRRRRPS